MKYFIKTFGCQMNKSDSERVATVLKRQGYKKVKNEKDALQPGSGQADLIIVNACSVRQSAVDRVYGLLLKFKKLKTYNSNLKTVLTGCVLKSDKKKFEKFFDKVLNIKEFLGENYLSLKPLYSSSFSAFVPIMTGCNNFCSYCVVPHTRGREISRSPKEIIKEVRSLVRKGYKEITLLGQNVNSYKGKIKNKKQKTKNTDKKSKTINFSNLLQILNKVSGKFIIKFLTNHPKDFSDKLIDAIAKCKKVAKEIHLPVQSGDDKILRRMNRGYTVGQYKNLVNRIREKIPQVKISTDVIVGFPGET